MSYVPEHMNQFHRNPPASVPLWGATTWPDGQTINYNSGNCWSTVASMEMAWALQGDFTHPRVPGGFECTGAEPPTPPRVRYWSGQHTSEGRIVDVVKAAQHWRAGIITMYGLPVDELKYRVQVLHQLVAVGSTYGLIKDDWSCQASFDGGHAILVREIGQHDFGGKGGIGVTTGWRVSDPLCGTVHWVPEAQILRSCEAYSKWAGHVTAYGGRTQEEIMALYNYTRDRVADVKRGAVLRNEPDGSGVATLAAIARSIPVVGSTKGGDYVALGFTKVGGSDIGRPLWVSRSDITDLRIEVAADEAAIRADERSKAAASATKAIEAARAEEQAKFEPIVASRTKDLQQQVQTGATDAAAFKAKVIERLRTADKDADAFLASIDIVPVAPAHK